MKLSTRVFAGILILLMSVAVFSLTAAAAGVSVQISLAGDLIIMDVSGIPAGDELDQWFLYYQAVSSSSWELIKSSADPNAELTIPQSLYISGNKFKVHITLASDGSSFSSNVVSVPFLDAQAFTLSIDDAGVVRWDYTGSAVTLHFQWLDNYVPVVYNYQPMGTKSFSYWITEYNTVQPELSAAYVDPLGQYKYTLAIYATSTVAGVTYTSNTVYRLGLDGYVLPESSGVDTAVYDPTVQEVQQHVNFLYHAVTRTPVYRYVISAIVIIVPMIALAYILKHWS